MKPSKKNIDRKIFDIETTEQYHTLEEISTRQETVKNTLPDAYKTLVYWETPGPRINFRMIWGPGNEERIAKTDGLTNNPRASRHYSRGCDTFNEAVKLSSIEEPELHFINPLLDYYETTENGNKVTVTIEKFRKGYVSLDTLIKTQGPLDNRSSEIIFSKYLKAETYLIKNMNMFHRDHKASNMLIKPDTLDFWLIDFTNAASIDAVTEKYMPTVGGHFITDPLLIGRFTGTERKYSLQSEIFGMGAEFYHMLTGDYAFEFDPDNGTAVHFGTKENVLDKDRKIDYDKYNKLLEKSLHKLKGDNKKWRPFIERLLTLKEENRYSSIDDMTKDFYRLMRKKSFKQHIKDHWVKYSAIGLFTLASAGLIVKGIVDKNGLEEEASKYKVYSEWNGTNMTIENNFTRPEISAYIYDTGSFQSFPETGFLKVKRGTKIDVNVHSNAFPRLKKDKYISALIPGKIYFEGFDDGKNFEILLTELESTRTPQDYPMYGLSGYSGYLPIKVPDDVSDGLVNVVVELYAPLETHNTQGVEDVKFTGGGNIIYRQTIPCIVGKEDNIAHLKTAKFSYNNYLSLYVLDNENFDSNIDTTIEYDVWVPEEGYKKTFPREDNNTNAYTVVLNDLPKGSSDTIRTLIVSQRRGKDILSFEALPIQRVAIDSTIGYYWWSLAVPGRDFSDKVNDYRDEYIKNFKQ